MEFDPREANANLLPEEWYDALIVDAVEKKSKQGNDMMVVTFKIYDNGGLQPTIDRYFVKSQAGLSGLRKVCRATGLAEVFESGRLTPDNLRGQGIRVLVKIQKDETGRYDDKNVAAQFDSQNREAVAPTTTGEPTDEPMPF